MLANGAAEKASSPWARRLKALARKVVTLVVAGIVFGWAFDWAGPRFYNPQETVGFWHGTLHGALMPVALPSLLLGKDVPIFTANNTGRTYKLGYIAGINLCGLVFFGLAFRQPRGNPKSEIRDPKEVRSPKSDG